MNFRIYKTRIAEFILVIAIEIICLILAVINSGNQNSLFFIGSGLVSTVALVLVYKNQKNFYNLILWTYFLLTEVTFTVNGGTFRLYFISSILIVLLLFNTGKLITNKIFVPFISLIIALIFSAILSSSISSALNSSIFLLLNMMGAFSTFLILYNKKITLEQFQNFIYCVLLVNVIFGLIQIVLFKLTGIPIGLGNNYTGQLSIAQIPGFRYEANTHGKLICFGILFCIPPMIRNFNQRKYRLLFILLLLSAIISPTRSATYAMIIALVVLFVWYIKQKLFTKMMSIVIGAIIGVSLFVLLISSGFINIGGYSAIKLDNFFLMSMDDINNDGSSGFRIRSLMSALELWNQSIKNQIFGVGYGQAYGFILGAGITRIGSNDFTTILVGTGLIGAIAYLSLFFTQANVLIKGARLSKVNSHKILCEQVLFINVYFLSIGFLSGCIQTPEMWMIFGISAYIYYRYKYQEDNEDGEF